MEQSKRITAQLAIATTCAVLALVSGCQATRSEAPVKVSSTETPQDAALSNSVRDRLLLAKAVELSAVKVVSSSGTVYLTGTVTSLDSRQSRSLGTCTVCIASSTRWKCRNDLELSD
jgi:osmotically-inducible protein OsmY